MAHQDLLVRRNDAEITGPNTLNGKRLCSATGTTSAKRVTELYKGKIDLLTDSTFSDCVKALASGDVDAVTTDDVILAGGQRLRLSYQLLHVQAGNPATDVFDMERLSPLDRTVVAQAVREVSAIQRRMANVSAYMPPVAWTAPAPT